MRKTLIISVLGMILIMIFILLLSVSSQTTEQTGSGDSSEGEEISQIPEEEPVNIDDNKKHEIGKAVKSSLDPDSVVVQNKHEQGNVELRKEGRLMTVEGNDDFLLQIKKSQEELDYQAKLLKEGKISESDLSDYYDYTGFKESVGELAKPRLKIQEEDGEVVVKEAEFRVDAEDAEDGVRKYVFGKKGDKWEITLPDKAKLRLRENDANIQIADIEMPGGSELIPPKRVGEEEGKDGEGIVFNYIVREGQVNLPKGNILQPVVNNGEQEPSTLSFQNGKAFFDMENTGNINNIEFMDRFDRSYHFKSLNDNQKRTYFYWDGKYHEGNSISMNMESDVKKIIINSKFHPLVFHEGNPVVDIINPLVYVDNPSVHLKNHFAVFTRENGRVDITREPGSDFPLVEIWKTGQGAQIDLGPNDALSILGDKDLYLMKGSILPTDKESGPVVELRILNEDGTTAITNLQRELPGDITPIGEGQRIIWANDKFSIISEDAEIAQSYLEPAPPKPVQTPANPFKLVSESPRVGFNNHNLGQRKAGFAFSKTTAVLAHNQEVAADILKLADSLRDDIVETWLGEKELPMKRDTIIYVKPADKDRAFAMRTSSERMAQIYLETTGKNPEVLKGGLKHELVHQVFDLQFPESWGDLPEHWGGLPKWVEEGIASSYDDQGKIDIRQGIVKGWVQNGNYPKVSDLLDNEVIKSTDTHSYALSESLAQFLILKGGEKGKTKFVEFADFSKRNSWDAALQEYYGISNVGDLQTKWQNWVKSNY
jgi:hypothetical protein